MTTTAPEVDLAGLLPAHPDRMTHRRLLRMKRAATAALGLSATVYLATVVRGPSGGVLGFVRAVAEAAMVGGLADWFAVTALFRHPLGLPIPHTALVPTKKDELATKLGEFVTGHFLTAHTISAQLGEARLVRRLGQRLADPQVAHRVSGEMAALMAAGLGALDEANVTEYVLELARRDLARRSYTPVLGRALARAAGGETQRPLVDVLVSRARTYLAESRAVLVPQIKSFLEARGLLGWLYASDKRCNAALDGLLKLLAEVDREPDHPLRGTVDGLLASWADQLQQDPQTAQRIDAALRDLLEEERFQLLLAGLVADLLSATGASLADAEGDLQHRLTLLVEDLGRRVSTDTEFERRLESVFLRGVVYVVDNYGDSVVTLIQRTVAGWEGRDAAARIEAAVGRDLQFIRINGTIVGGLAGLAIHAVTVALS